jgi:hypothetical protein
MGAILPPSFTLITHIMIIKGGTPSPVKVNKGKNGYNVWVYKNSETHPDGVQRHHYKSLTTKGKFFSHDDALAVGWDYVENQSYAHCAA